MKLTDYLCSIPPDERMLLTDCLCDVSVDILYCVPAADFVQLINSEAQTKRPCCGAVEDMLIGATNKTKNNRDSY